MILPQKIVAIFTVFIMIYQIIKSDLFNISNRIKQIDPKYFVVFNKKRKKFEVHYKRLKNTYELTIPYDNLDSRAIDFVQKTRIENRKKILEEIEKSNKLLEVENQRKRKENLRRIPPSCRPQARR